MQQAPKIISNHRLARLFLWARLWLVWFELRFAVLGDTPEAREALAQKAQSFARLALIEATRRLAPRKRSAHGGAPRDYARHINVRALIGARVRRALAGADAATRYAALKAFERDFETHIARLVRRLARGLTRLAPIPPSRGAETRARAVATHAAFAHDSS